MSRIFVESTVQAPIEKVWEAYTQVADIKQWNAASEDWHCTDALNDLTVGGKFAYTMAAKDGSFSFVFSGTYDRIEFPHYMEYTLDDGRGVEVHFEDTASGVHVRQGFDPENTHPVDFQQAGWQAILDNFAKYAATIARK